jgi:HAD superfamily phosphoserine phosphatase-like hydrolase
MSARVAAFFDLDGTLLPLPSLEQRFFRIMRNRREIPLWNYFRWLREALKLFPRGIGCVIHANKMYLRGVPSFSESRAEDCSDSPAHKSGHQDEGQASAPSRHDPRQPVPLFFAEGVERVAWHAKQEHAIVIVSGTLEPLANAAARALEIEVTARGIAAGIRVCATKLEESEGQWTGRIFGEAIFGKAKRRAVLALAEEMSLDLSQSWAYGDSGRDRWMLAAVGNPVAVNAKPKLARIAGKRGWRILRTANRVHQIARPMRQVERCA